MFPRCPSTKPGTFEIPEVGVACTIKEEEKRVYSDSVVITVKTVLEPGKTEYKIRGH